MKDLKTQFIKDENGKACFVVVDDETYKGLVGDSERLHHTENILKAFADEDVLPHLIDAQIVHRLAEGENPVRVWREYRGLKAIELAKAAGISAAYLSEIETGKKDGTFKTMASIAHILEIGLDDLAPLSHVTDSQAQATTFRLRAIKTHIEKLNSLIAQDAFDTAAVRMAASKLKSHIEQLEPASLEESWLMEAYEKASHSLLLIEEAEKNIIHTATLTKEKLLKTLAGGSMEGLNQGEYEDTSVSKLFSKKSASSQGQ